MARQCKFAGAVGEIKVGSSVCIIKIIIIIIIILIIVTILI